MILLLQIAMLLVSGCSFSLGFKPQQYRRKDFLRLPKQGAPYTRRFAEEPQKQENLRRQLPNTFKTPEASEEDVPKETKGNHSFGWQPAPTNKEVPAQSNSETTKASNETKETYSVGWQPAAGNQELVAGATSEPGGELPEGPAESAEPVLESTKIKAVLSEVTETIAESTEPTTSEPLLSEETETIAESAEPAKIKVVLSEVTVILEEPDETVLSEETETLAESTSEPMLREELETLAEPTDSEMSEGAVPIPRDKEDEETFPEGDSLWQSDAIQLADIDVPVRPSTRSITRRDGGFGRRKSLSVDSGATETIKAAIKRGHWSKQSLVPVADEDSVDLLKTSTLLADDHASGKPTSRWADRETASAVAAVERGPSKPLPKSLFLSDDQGSGNSRWANMKQRISLSDGGDTGKQRIPFSDAGDVRGGTFQLKPDADPRKR